MSDLDKFNYECEGQVSLLMFLMKRHSMESVIQSRQSVRAWYSTIREKTIRV